MADNSSFSIGDIGSAVGSFVRDAGGTFAGKILDGAKNRALTLSGNAAQSIIKAMSPSKTPTGTANATQLVTSTQIKSNGLIQNAVNKVFGITLSTTQVYAVICLSGVLAVLLIVKGLRR